MKTKYEVKIKSGALEKLMQDAYSNIDNVTIGFVLSDITGMSYEQIYRIRNGKSKVGSNFIANILIKNPDKRFEDIFFIQ